MTNRQIPDSRSILIASFVVAVVAFFGVAGAPHYLSVAPLGPTILALMMGEAVSFSGWIWYALALIFVWTALVAVLSSALFLRLNRAWEVSLATYVLLLLSNGIFLAQNWSNGVNWLGHFYTNWVLAVNVVFAVLCAYLLNRSRPKSASARTLLISHFSTMLWLGWYAFPWLGEMP